jgi:hypothetical protein
MFKPTKKRRDYPYYKLQVNNKVSMSWKDVRGAFDTLEDAAAYTKLKLQNDEVRVIVVEEKKRYELK